MNLFVEDIIVLYDKLENNGQDGARAPIYVYDTDEDRYKEIECIKLDVEGNIIIDVSY